MHAARRLRSNRPDWNVLHGDVTRFDGRPYFGVDLLAGEFLVLRSLLRVINSGEDDERDLFPHALRLVEEMMPRAVMLENVRGFLSPDFAAIGSVCLRAYALSVTDQTLGCSMPLILEFLSCGLAL